MTYKPEYSAKTAMSDAAKPSQDIISIFEGSYQGIQPGRVEVLEYGAGNGRHANYIRNLGYTVYGYDPYNGQDTADPYASVSSKLPPHRKKFGVVFTAFVLNVVDYNTMLLILKDAEKYTKKGGYTIHRVREDLRSLKGGDMYTSKGTYQRDIPIQQLKDLGYTREGKLFIKQKDS